MNGITKIIILLISCLLVSSGINAQQTESLRDRLAKKQQQQQGTTPNNGIKVPKISVRAQMRNEDQTQNLSNATWMREIYRELDLTKGKNAALFYPVQPINGKMNLYTLIFKLMGEGNLVAYNWNNGTDLFVEDQLVNFGDVLKKLEIPYRQNGDVYDYDEFSIPSNEALSYYVKEAWYFDQSNSVVDVKIVAICPVLFRQTYDDIDFGIGNAQGIREPQFWIPYENIRPYAAAMPIMTSDLNNIMNRTIDDYFRLRLYDGEIYKTTNMEDKFLKQKYETPEALEAAQKKIENELNQFDKDLWVINDSIKALDQQSRNTKQKKTKISQPKSSSSSATYSARDRLH